MYYLQILFWFKNTYKSFFFSRLVLVCLLERTGINDQSVTDTLPLDLLHEVFSWPPANRLMRLTPMCNEWQTSISSLRFVKQHLLLLYMNNNTRSDKLIFSAHMDGSRIAGTCDPPDCLQFVGSCDGLLCIDGSCNLIVWNPVTKT
ncbi:putative F-box-like domain superfamily protein [Helianthus anomalus]